MAAQTQRRDKFAPLDTTPTPFGFLRNDAVLTGERTRRSTAVDPRATHSMTELMAHIRKSKGKKQFAMSKLSE